MRKIIVIQLGLIFGACMYAGDDKPSQRLQSLVKDTTFASFDLGLSQDEMQQLQNLTINTKSAINNYGHLDTLESEIVDFLKSLGNSNEDAQAASKIISNIVMRDISPGDDETAWISLRAFTPNESYDLPRWHTDGAFYRSAENVCYKQAYALKGASTLFLQLPDDMRAQFFNIQNKTFAGMTYAEIKSLSEQEIDALILPNRIKLAELVTGYHVHTAPANTGTIFVTGGRNRGAIHSEPPMHENRLFMSVVPGTPEQIQEWYTREHPGK